MKAFGVCVSMSTAARVGEVRGSGSVQLEPGRHPISVNIEPVFIPNLIDAEWFQGWKAGA